MIIYLPQTQDYLLNNTKFLHAQTKMRSNYQLIACGHSFTHAQSSISILLTRDFISYCSLFSSVAAELRQFAGGGDLRVEQRWEIAYLKSPARFSLHKCIGSHYVYAQLVSQYNSSFVFCKQSDIFKPFALN